MTTPQNPALVLVDRAYRGSVETQFADVLYIIRELNRQTGGLHLALRGHAVTYAVAAPEYEPSVHLGSRTLDTLPDPRRSVRTMLDEGATVWVEEADLQRIGPKAASRLLPGTRTAAPGELALRWFSYSQVWFM
ncbi:hypothetical protein GCM10023347_02210 [Streptomyces chumphonensis]|uniref:Uncharacterized protein n=1 Tax=Streptomyces chumphonensis TaxID=1214925 RepID=A0A927F564_9ACTN|nr:hypothetical protein [Streptomyces chumphonensis]MBD3934567.1 hypothetical protein [Streptomyces chumphonensis]